MDGELTISGQFEGHEFTVWSLAMTSDGLTIISGGQDATIRLWDVGTGKELQKMRGHEGPVYGLAVTANNQRLVSIADKDLAVKIWDLNDYSLISSLAPNSIHINTVSVSPDQRYVVTGGNDGVVRFWDIDRGVLLRTLECNHGIYSMMISPDGRYLLCGSKVPPASKEPGVATIWDFELGVHLKTLKGHQGHVTALAMTADSRYILTGGLDGDVNLWDLETGTLLKTMSGHKSSVIEIHITQDGHHLITGSNDGTVRTWILRGGILLKQLSHTENVHSLIVTPDGRQVITGSMEGLVEIWDFEKDSPWFDRSKEDAEARRAELEAFRVVQLRKIVSRYETLPLDRLATLLRFDSLEALEDWLLELPAETPIKIDGPNIVVRK
jgi:WD40 repeat protein